jgi:hypothetical protein
VGVPLDVGVGDGDVLDGLDGGVGAVDDGAPGLDGTPEPGAPLSGGGDTGEDTRDDAAAAVTFTTRWNPVETGLPVGGEYSHRTSKTIEVAVALADIESENVLLWPGLRVPTSHVRPCDSERHCEEIEPAAELTVVAP